MEKLPIDIILDILSRLPHQTMINCKLVSKPWRDIISSNIKVGFLLMLGAKSRKLFYGGEEYDDIDMNGDYSYKTLVEIDNHRSTIEQQEAPLSTMLGSCNGLVCFRVRSKFTIACDPIYICNPVTEEYVYLPPFNRDQTSMGKIAGYFSYGFGYHHSMDEYKDVRIYHDYYNRQVQVYTLGSGHGWRDIGRTGHRLFTDPGVCANGALHWFESSKNNIVAFHLEDEKFRLIPLPPLLLPNPHYCTSFHTIGLKLFGGYLYVVHIDGGEEHRIIDIWALEKNRKCSCYDMKEHEFNDLWSWSKKFSIPCPKHMRYVPFGVTKSNQVLLSSTESIFCYDSETRILRKLWGDSPEMIVGAIPHVNSLVSLEAFGENSNRRK